MKLKMSSPAASIGILACLAVAGPASAALIQIPQPGSSYTGCATIYTACTTLLPITAADFTTINSLSDANLTVSFSAGVEARTVPATFKLWNSPPAVETSTPRVLLTQGISASSVTLTFSKPLQTFGVEAQPDLLGVSADITENFFNGATNIGTIVRNVNSNGGALLFAGTVTAPTAPITSVTLTGAGGVTDFAIAQVRYQLAAAPPPPGVPEPATWMGLATGLALLGCQKLRRR